jgi:hypothetical protein
MYETAMEPDHIEVDIIRQLEDIEKNEQSVGINALTVQVICSKFNKDLLVDFFSKGEHKRVVECVSEVLKRIKTLNNAQLLGLLTAAFTLDQTTWIKATTALG